jgi:hypothetical protein
MTKQNEIPGPTPRSNSTHGGELEGVYRDKMIEAMRDTINVLIARHQPSELIAMLEDIVKEYEDRTTPTIR